MKQESTALRHLALFLPFSYIDKPQIPATRGKSESLQRIEKNAGNWSLSRIGNYLQNWSSANPLARPTFSDIRE